MSDEDLFAEEMAGVTPLGREARVRLVKERLSEDQQRERRQAAAREESVVNPLGTTKSMHGSIFIACS